MPLGLLICAFPNMLRLFTPYRLSENVADFMVGLGVTLVIGSFILMQKKTAC
jgi:hypothetical protein